MARDKLQPVFEAIGDRAQSRNNLSVAHVLRRLVDRVVEFAASPGVGDDEQSGYSAGTLWINTSAEHAFICIKNTLGAAVWKQMT